MPPHEMRYSGLATVTGARRVDQPGRMTGSVVLDGERLAVDCYSLRDRTWGPHRRGASPAGDYRWVIASPESPWHAVTIAGDEPGVDTVRRGHLVRDGERTAPRWRGWPGRMASWTLTDWRWDGLQGWGEDQEFFPRERIRALTRD